MRVVDTSAWIEWLLGDELQKTLRPHFTQKDRVPGSRWFSLNCRNGYCAKSAKGKPMK